MTSFGEIRENAFQYYPPLRKVKRYVEENYSQVITLSTAAEIAGMERKYFSTFFHRRVGIVFRFWLMWFRIQEAMRLLESENNSITQIAFNVGFTDLRTFERAFRRCTGTTALEFKKRVQASERPSV